MNGQEIGEYLYPSLLTIFLFILTKEAHHFLLMSY